MIWIAYVISGLLAAAGGITLLGALLGRDPRKMTQEEIVELMDRSSSPSARRIVGGVVGMAKQSFVESSQLIKEKVNMMSEGYFSGEEEQWRTRQ